jgi:hypothetical protein
MLLQESKRPFFSGSTCCLYLLSMLSFDCFCICHSFPIDLFFLMRWHMSKLTFFLSNWHCRIPKLYYPKLYVLMSPPLKTLWCSRIFIYNIFLMDHLHKHEFITFLIDDPSDTTWTHFRSCVGPITGVWLLAHPIILAFNLSLVHFLTTLCICLDLPHPTITHISCCQCELTNDDFKYLFTSVPMWNEHTATHYILKILLQLLLWRMEHTYKEKLPTFCLTIFND